VQPREWPRDVNTLSGGEQKRLVAVLGANGSGKSSFLRLLAGEQVPHEGVARLGARVVPGFFAQTHARPDLADGLRPRS
jgi:ATPase subunit of ABC transporter with duplicated ATPase domains